MVDEDEGRGRGKFVPPVKFIILIFTINNSTILFTTIDERRNRMMNRPKNREK